MNAYYHAFTPGFNFWYLAAPLFAVIVAIIGARVYYMDGDSKKIYRRRYNGLLCFTLSIVFAIAIAFMIGSESFRGIVQYFDNGLERFESPVWSLVGAGMTVAMFSILYAGLLILIGRVAAWAKHGYLVEKRMELRHQERQG